MTATNIDWSVDLEEAWEKIQEMDNLSASNVLGVNPLEYRDSSEDVRRDITYHVFRHAPGKLDDFMGLPDKVEIPDEVSEYGDDYITDWLSDVYGYCINGYELSE